MNFTGLFMGPMTQSAVRQPRGSSASCLEIDCPLCLGESKVHQDDAQPVSLEVIEEIIGTLPPAVLEIAQKNGISRDKRIHICDGCYDKVLLDGLILK